MRTLPTFLTLTAVATVVLTGCSTSPDPSATPSASAAAIECTDPGSTSDAVNVTGDAGAEPTVTFETPLATKATERTVVTEGTGDAVEEGDSVAISYAAYNATTGAKLTAGGFGDAAGLTVNVVDGQAVIPGILKGVACSNVGDRVAVVFPPADGFGEAGNTDLGVAATDQLLFVIDIKEKLPTRATGEDQEPTDGFPAVKLAKDGEPTVTMPKSDPPAELGVEVLKKGDGAAVTETSTVTVQYTGAIWDTGKVFDQSWGVGPTTFPVSGLITGFTQGLVGQTVGSQVVIVIPPGELGYEGGNETAGISETDTLVFVVDIIAAA
ncbi:peptidylprolyl isomerase [Cryobacterium adonitolivorans]|uniref:peptidylprolyl isomerase n=1 Tax=Cryobacterium adonitolivorans TaxID=1259189 RepID=A0A4R8VYW9_9MICO|nr:FKBP-type peptidyl-prolyl cis-trans isomerase [Cryobacterium adonitolivorans]TFB99024.1 peptidylprolyl isomerase [Cryobacterium adonitolivorans]